MTSVKRWKLKDMNISKKLEHIVNITPVKLVVSLECVVILLCLESNWETLRSYEYVEQNMNTR